MKTSTTTTMLRAAQARAGVRLASLVAVVRCSVLDHAHLLGATGSEIALQKTLGTSIPTTRKQPEPIKSMSSSSFGWSWSFKNLVTCFALNSYEDRMKPGGASA